MFKERGGLNEVCVVFNYSRSYRRGVEPCAKSLLYEYYYARYRVDFFL